MCTEVSLIFPYHPLTAQRASCEFTSTDCASLACFDHFVLVIQSTLALFSNFQKNFQERITYLTIYCVNHLSWKEIFSQRIISATKTWQENKSEKEHVLDLLRKLFVFVQYFHEKIFTKRRTIYTSAVVKWECFKKDLITFSISINQCSSKIIHVNKNYIIFLFPELSAETQKSNEMRN